MFFVPLPSHAGLRNEQLAAQLFPKEVGRAGGWEMGVGSWTASRSLLDRLPAIAAIAQREIIWHCPRKRGVRITLFTQQLHAEHRSISCWQTGREMRSKFHQIFVYGTTWRL